MQSSIGGVGIDRPTSAPPPAEDSRIGNLRPSPLLTSVSAANSAVSSPAFPTHSSASTSTSKGKGLQLGANKMSSAASAALINRLADEAAAENGGDDDSNPWGTEDLMDVNADEDDWSELFTALLNTYC